MLAKTIIDCDAFSNMPVEAQMLYVRLNMAADDDGFIKNPRMIMRMCGASDDSMKLLIAKKFVLSFEYGDDFVFLIKHWKIHNYIRNDRYKESTFKSLLRQVYYDENKAYSLTPGEGKTPVLPPTSSPSPDRYTDGIPTVDPGKDRLELVQGRLEEESVVQDNNSFSLSSKEKEEEKEIPLSDEHAERVLHFARMVNVFKSRGFDASGAYALANTEGITREEIDAARAAEKADEST